MPQALLLTAGLEVGQQAVIHPLSGLAAVKLPLGLPSLRHAREAGTIRLREIPVQGKALLSSASKSHENKPRDWLDLLLRESLGLYWDLLRQIIPPSIFTFSTFSICSRSQILHVRSIFRSLV